MATQVSNFSSLDLDRLPSIAAGEAGAHKVRAITATPQSLAGYGQRWQMPVTKALIHGHQRFTFIIAALDTIIVRSHEDSPRLVRIECDVAGQMHGQLTPGPSAIARPHKSMRGSGENRFRLTGILAHKVGAV